MVKIEAKLSLYDHNSCSDLSCSKEDDLEALTFIFGYERYLSKPVNSQNVEKKPLNKERTHRNVLMVKCGSVW